MRSAACSPGLLSIKLESLGLALAAYVRLDGTDGCFTLQTDVQYLRDKTLACGAICGRLCGSMYRRFHFGCASFFPVDGPTSLDCLKVYSEHCCQCLKRPKSKFADQCPGSSQGEPQKRTLSDLPDMRRSYPGSIFA